MLKRALMYSFAASAVTMAPIVLADAKGPTLSGNASAQECVDAFRLARTMFDSASTRLYAPLKGIDGLASELVLGASALDISGGDELEADSAAFDKLPQPEFQTRSVYWQRTAQDGVRIAVHERPVGWRGDMYSLYILPSGLDKNAFLAEVGDESAPPKHTALISDSWRPPLVFQTKSNHSVWFIDVGPPYVALGSWNVYRPDSGHLEPVCTIQFRSPGPDVLSALPEPVASLARLVDETLGPGLNEGTLQPTARLRVDALHVWANVAQRPWAVSEADVYNSREEVDAGLKAWSSGGDSYLHAYKEIVAAYPIALRALSAYYEKTFSLRTEKAQRLAEYVLDIALRANYTFSNGGDYFRYDNVNNNPWKLHDQGSGME